MQLSYRTQFIIFISIFILALSISSLLYLRYTQDRFIEANLKTQANVITHLIADDLARLILLDDPDIVASITFKLKSVTEIYRADFFDLKGKQVLEFVSDALPQKDSTDIVKSHIIKLYKEVEYDGVKLGHVNIQLYSHELQQIKNQADSNYLTFLFIMFWFSVFLILLLDNRFISRLSQLSNALKTVAQKNDFSIRLLDDRQDDIGQAKKHFNNLVEIVEKQTNSLKYLAFHDSLTQLYNRNHLIKELEMMLEQRPENGYHAVCYLDLDQFKVVNDTCGHANGDVLLCQLAVRFLDVIQEYDDVILGRIGGDEFIILIREQTKETIERLLLQIQQVINQYEFTFLERKFQIGVSIGCILFSDESTSASELLSAADALCYQVKNNNRGDLLVQFLDDKDLLDYQDAMNWVSIIYDALNEDRFEVYLQPIVGFGRDNKLDNFLSQNTDTEKDIREKLPAWDHFEVLIRLKQNGKTISPAHFIPVAERYGLTKKLDLWVIQKVFDYLRKYPDFLKQTDLIAINLSALSIVDSRFVDEIIKMIYEYRIPTGKICLEITETGVITDLFKAQQFIQLLKQEGVSFALDDFGSGMSSFGYLKELDVQFLKIDGQFVRNIANDKAMEEMVHAMIRIGHISGKKVIAEQVEDQATARILLNLGTDYMQGYFFSRPEPVSSFL